MRHSEPKPDTILEDFLASQENREISQNGSNSPKIVTAEKLIRHRRFNRGCSFPVEDAGQNPIEPVSVAPALEVQGLAESLGERFLCIGKPHACKALVA
jgi:hypothetical protein